MKKKMIFALLLAGMSFATPSKVEAQETNRPAPCGMYVIDCKWLGTGDWVACLQGGKGSCECGSYTDCQGGWW